ncbi:MAG: hypothetical protein HZB23_05850 [Deltaproteobacteria bacterium]|nr:hypothetical protein [Deltaproteobacteria bacterium]
MDEKLCTCWREGFRRPGGGRGPGKMLQAAKDWIPAYAGMTDGVASLVITAPNKAENYSKALFLFICVHPAFSPRATAYGKFRHDLRVSGFPGSAGVPPASAAKAGGTPALPGKKRLGRLPVTPALFHMRSPDFLRVLLTPVAKAAKFFNSGFRANRFPS